MRMQKLKIRKILAILAAIFLLVSDMPAKAATVSMSTDKTGSTNGTEAPSQTADEAPAFYAYIDFTPQGYAVLGETEFPADTCRVQNLYSLDGINYEVYHREWNMPGPIESSVTSGCAIQVPQICLQSNDEPLRDYLDGTLDRFYLKLLITKEDGTAYESKAVLIERNREPQPIPEGTPLIANFSNSMKVSFRPSYGRYQLTVPDNATEEDIAACLPDTLPVRVQVGNMLCDIDCPVIWKPFTISGLTAGESVVIEDAAEPITVPGGTLLDTPLGIFRLDEPLLLGEMPWSANKVQLVLNVVSASEGPAGALVIDREMLKMSFVKKPTGATDIRAYTLSEGETVWTEIQGLSLLNAVNSQPSTANSDYAVIFDKDTEPFRSYLAAKAAGDTPVPFFVGLKIEGGVYDGKQLVLPWPDNYGNLPSLPVGDSGSGGNEGNAGSDNKNDSTEEGQRPNLPQQPDDTPDQPIEGGGQAPGVTQPPENNENPPEDSENLPEDHENPDNGNIQNPGDTQPPGNIESQPEGNGSTQNPDGIQPPQSSTNLTEDNSDSQSPDSIQQPESAESQPESSKNGQSPDSIQQPENPADNKTIADSGNQQNVIIPQQPESDGTVTVFAPKTETPYRKKSVGRRIAFFTIAGTTGIAGICTAIFGKETIVRFFGKIIGKIRSLLQGIVK